MDRIVSTQDMRDVQVVRVVWGNFDMNPILTTPQFNEVVYVWGKDNRDRLKSFGYETILMGRDNLNYKYAHPKYHFMHKLIGINTALNTYSKILFLDWDCDIVKELDDDFFNSLNDKKLLAPIYSYLKSDYTIIYEKADEWNELQSNLLNTLSWSLDDMFVIPNAGFIYISDKKVSEDLLNLANDNNLTTMIEEFSLYSYANTTLDSYIELYHPNCVYGTSETNSINGYVNTKLNMNIYFEHK